MRGYSHIAITMNNREVALPEILSGSAGTCSPFESETFTFIREWFGEKDSFTLNTSGSTGAPKKITLFRKQLKHSAHRTITAIGLSNNDTVLVCLDTKYIAGKMMLVRAFEGNMKVIAMEPSSSPLSNINQIKIDFAAFVPLQLIEMLKQENCRSHLNKMKAIIVGGAALPATQLQDIKKLKCHVYATYGMTETVSHIALQLLNGVDAQDYFYVLPGIKIEKDARGCLTIQMPEFEEKFITNDLVELIANDKFRWVGRYDNVINSGGFKISPEKIEQEIEKILPEKSFFITGISDTRLGEKLILVMEGNLINNIDFSGLNLHPYEIPKEIIHLPEFIRTETGKINRQKTMSLIN